MNNLQKTLFPVLLTAALVFPAIVNATPPNDKFLNPNSGIEIPLPVKPLPKPKPIVKSVFHTKEFQALLDFETQVDSIRRPVTKKAQERLQNERKLLAARTLLSIHSVYAFESDKLRNDYIQKRRVIRNQSELSLTIGNKEIDLWYEKNKDTKGAKEKARKMRINLAQMVAAHEASSLEATRNDYLVASSQLETEYKNFEERTRALNEKLKAAIDALPLYR